MMKKLHLLFLVLVCLGYLNSAKGQVNYLQNFDTNNGSYTVFTRFTGTTACGGSGGSMRKNIYSSGTQGAMVSPQVGTSLGGLTTISFDYKVANWSANTTGTSGNWGNFVVQYGATASGPWTNIATVDQNNHVVSGSCANKSFTFTPSAGALFIRFNATYGTTGDYYLNFDNISLTEVTNNCSGTPNPGNTIASAATACVGGSVNLSLQNATSGGGVTYQWQSADDMAFTNNVTNLGTTAAISATINSPKYYRCEVTCNNSTGTSSPVLIGLKDFYQCYCTAVPTSIDGNGITNVVLGTLSNPNVSTTRYQDFTTGLPVPVLTGGDTYPMSVTLQTGYSYVVRVFIDFNRNGNYNDPGENLLLGESTSASPYTLNGSISIPLEVMGGLTGMRVIGWDDDGNEPCYNGAYANVEDYVVELVEPQLCTGIPNPGNTLATVTRACVGGSSVLSLQNQTSGIGVTYQWFDDNGPIQGANGNTFTTPALEVTTVFYCVVGCESNQEAGASVPVTVEIVPQPVGGNASGPATGETYEAQPFTVTGSVGSLQWQSATSAGGTYSNIVGANTENTNITFVAGGTFYLRCKASDAGCTDAFSNIISIQISVNGDNVCDAIELEVGNNGQFSNAGATSEANEVVPPGSTCRSQNTWCNNTGTKNSVWFTFTPENAGKYSFTMTNQDFDSQMALYSATDCSFGSFTMIAANDDNVVPGTGLWSRIEPVCLQGGETYYILVDGYNTTTNNNWGVLVEQAPNAAPVLTQCPQNISVCGSLIAEWALPSANDDCGNVELSSNFNPGDEFPAGVSTVTYVATDEGGATAVCSFTVSVSPEISLTAEVTPAPCQQLTASVSLFANGGYGQLTYSPNNPPTEGLNPGYYTYYVTDDLGCYSSVMVVIETPVNPCTAPTPVCGNIITVYAYPGNLAYNGPGTADVYLIPAVALDGGTFSYSPGTLTRQVKRTLTNVAFNWTTNGACLDATPNGVYNNNDKGLVYRNCLPVSPADFNQVRNFDMTLTDQFGTSNCSGRYKVVQGTPPGGNTNAEIVEIEEALTRSLDGEFDIFPNPGTTQVFVNVSLENDAVHTLTVFDAMGREVKKLDQLNQGINVLDTEDLIPGIYTMVLKGGETLNTIKWLRME
ncbi:MAG: HYR domain-containing protein [Saprospiraceae bacterium]|nr:HYR domain-containing protein [Saprospiraceae bacterium]